MFSTFGIQVDMNFYNLLVYNKNQHVFCYGSIPVEITHMFQGNCTSIGASVWCPDPVELTWISREFKFFERVTHICVSKLTITGSDNGLSPDRRQAIIWTNAGMLLIGPLETNFSEILIKILTFSFKKMRLKCRLRNDGHFVLASICKCMCIKTKHYTITEHAMYFGCLPVFCDIHWHRSVLVFYWSHSIMETRQCHILWQGPEKRNTLFSTHPSYMRYPYGDSIELDVFGIYILCTATVGEMILPHYQHMITSSDGNISVLLVLCAGNSPVTGEFPSQRPVTRSFDVFVELLLTKRMCKQSRRWWYEPPSR